MSRFSDLSKDMRELSNATNEFVNNINELAKEHQHRLDELDKRAKTYDFWKSLKKAQREYLHLDVNGDGTFGEFMLYEYGIQLYFDGDNYIKPDFDIVDEHKHLLFVLKYT
jgi:hypothetical protein